MVTLGVAGPSKHRERGKMGRMVGWASDKANFLGLSTRFMDFLTALHGLRMA